MSLRLVPQSVTSNDLERRSRNFCIISPNSVAFGTACVKVVENTTILSAAEMQAIESSFYRAAWNADSVQRRESGPSVCMYVSPSVRPSVRLSVCLSVKRVDCAKTEERSVQIFIPYERSFSLFSEKKNCWQGGDHFYIKFWVNWPPLEQNRRFSTDIRSQCFSRNTQRKKVQVTLIGSPLRAFQ